MPKFEHTHGGCPVPAIYAGRGGPTLGVRGRSVSLNSLGFPSAITSNGRRVLSTPVQFQISVAGKAVPYTPVPADSSHGDHATASGGGGGGGQVKPPPLSVQLGAGGAEAVWTQRAEAADKSFQVQVDGSMAYDGHIRLGVIVTVVGNQPASQSI